MKIYIICLFVFVNGPLHATLDCEHYLVKDGAKAAAHVLNHEFFGHSANLKDVEAVQEPALHRLGLFSPPHGRSIMGTLVKNKEGSLFPVQFSVEQFDGVTTVTLASIRFPDSNPTLWVRLKPSEGNTKISFEDLFEEFPPPKQIDHRQASYLGFHSDPAIDGTRTYVTVHRADQKRINQIELGIDVPCDLYDLFAAVKDVEMDRPLRVRTNAVEYCRVSVLKFEAAP